MKPKISRYFDLALSLVLLALFCGCNKQSQTSGDPAPLASTAKPALVSAEKTSFDQVAAKLNPGGNFYLYLSTEQALAGLSGKVGSFSNFLGSLPNVPPDGQQNIGKILTFANTWIKDSGVEEISGVGMSSIAREKGLYYTKTVLHHYSGQDSGLLWSVFGQKPHPLQDLDLLPETTALAFFSDLNLPLAWTNVQQQINQLDMVQFSTALQQWPAQFRKLTGLDFNDVLASLGGDYGLILTLDEQKQISIPVGGQTMEIASPALVLVFKVNSDVIFNRVDEAMKGNPLVVRVDKPGLKMRTVTIPLPLPLDLHPCIARSGDYLLLSSSDSVVQDILAVKAGQKNGFKSTEAFKRLAQGIPDAGNNFSIMAPSFSTVLRQIQGQMLANKSGVTASQGASMQQLFSAGTNAASYAVGVNGTEGWEGFANGTQSMQSILVPAVAGAAGMMAAIAIPNFTKARDTAQYNRIINNLRMVDAAKQQWTLEKQKEIGNTV
ncbi:MAG TPA: hypothetical protein VFC44_15925, partial [Candidatus Saccharimonadales bacterium]|nr:hypothetical protein [Candidatus Saccharimonadales bacterium]